MEIQTDRWKSETGMEFIFEYVNFCFTKVDPLDFVIWKALKIIVMLQINIKSFIYQFEKINMSLVCIQIVGWNWIWELCLKSAPDFSSLLMRTCWPCSESDSKSGKLFESDRKNNAAIMHHCVGASHPHCRGKKSFAVARIIISRQLMYCIP